VNKYYQYLRLAAETTVAAIREHLLINSARKWIRGNLSPSKFAIKSAYMLKHAFERDRGKTYIRESLFTEALTAEGFTVDGTNNVYAKFIHPRTPGAMRALPKAS